MNDFIKQLKSRRSCRSYRPDSVPHELIEQIAEAGTYAATGMGMQSPIIIAVSNKELRDKLMLMNASVLGNAGADPFYGAPVIFVVLADRSRPTAIYDGSLVLGNMMNAAASLGLGSCWIHRAKEVFESAEGRSILKELGVTGDYEGIGHLAVGYPAEAPAPAKPRKPDYVRYAD